LRKEASRKGKYNKNPDDAAAAASEISLIESILQKFDEKYI